jgi:hypothetical protein
MKARDTMGNGAASNSEGPKPTAMSAGTQQRKTWFAFHNLEKLTFLL